MSGFRGLAYSFRGQRWDPKGLKTCMCVGTLKHFGIGFSNS